MPSLFILLLTGVLTLTGTSLAPTAGASTVPPSSTPTSAPALPSAAPPSTIPPSTLPPPASQPQTVPPSTVPEPVPEAPGPSTTIEPGEDADDPVEPVQRVALSPSVSDAIIPIGSIVLAALVLVAVALASFMLHRRRAGTPPGRTKSDEAITDPTTAASNSVHPPGSAGAPVAHISKFLLALGESLIDAGAAVSHVESTLHDIARVNGVDDLGVIVLPTALIVSVPGSDDVATRVSSAGRAPLRLDQIDDVFGLVREASSGAVDPAVAQRRLAAIRSSAPPFRARVAIVGSACSAAGLVTILRGGWSEIAVAIVLGLVIGAFRLSTHHLGSSYQPFVPLVAAAVVSISVFTLARIESDLMTFPLLVAPLITFLPGAVLTMAVLELATGQIISGVARLASGGMQLILLAIGIVAGRQLVGVPSGTLRASFDGPLAVIAPWVGVAVFGLGVVWFNGARTAARIWILLVLYVAYSGQVIGGLFFGSSLSAFFGALVMTPVAILAARQPSGPTPLVTFLPGFWILVPGALGLDGVTQVIDGGAPAGSSALVTTITSMVGVSLGILLGSNLAGGTTDGPEPAATDESDAVPRTSHEQY